MSKHIELNFDQFTQLLRTSSRLVVFASDRAQAKRIERLCADLGVSAVSSAWCSSQRALEMFKDSIHAEQLVLIMIATPGSVTGWHIMAEKCNSIVWVGGHYSTEMREQALYRVMENAMQPDIQVGRFIFQAGVPEGAN